MNEYTYESAAPSVEDYCALHDAVKWGNASREATERALQNSLFAVRVLHEGRVIGQARVVGDDSLVFYIQDVIVHPDHQGKGIGSRMLEMVFDYIRPRASVGSFIGLMSAERAVGLYEKFGFSKRPESMPGMEIRIKK